MHIHFLHTRTIQTGSVTPNGNGRLFVTGLVFHASNTITINSEFTIAAQNNWHEAGEAEGGAIAYKIQTSGAAENPIWSWSNATFAATTMATFVDTATARRIFLN